MPQIAHNANRHTTYQLTSACLAISPTAYHAEIQLIAYTAYCNTLHITIMQFVYNVLLIVCYAHLLQFVLSVRWLGIRWLMVYVSHVCPILKFV